MNYQIKCVANTRCICGEGPVWHQDKLYWVDIPLGKLYSYDPHLKKYEVVFEEGQIGGFTIQADGNFLLFMEKGKIGILKKTGLEIIVENIQEAENGRFNDVIADPHGRVFCGTLMNNFKNGCLYRLDRNGGLTKILDGLQCANGMGFNFDLTKMYFTDSTPGKIYVFDYHQRSGALTNQKILIDISQEEGVPDGLLVDKNDNIWSARWDGACIVKYNLQGLELERINFPTKKITSMAFGGGDYQDMYVTTAGADDKIENGDKAGNLFHIKGAFNGKKDFFSKILI